MGERDNYRLSPVDLPLRALSGQCRISDMKTTTKCGKCDGKGKLSWTNVAGGVCFVCGGDGQLVVDEALVAARRWSRASVISGISALLVDLDINEREFGGAWYSADPAYEAGKLLAHADADVRAHALAAFERKGASPVVLGFIAKIEALEVANLVAGIRRVTRNVRRVAA